MSCRRIQEKLMLYQERELPERESREIRRHLMQCACCSAVAREMTELERVSGYALGTTLTAPASLDTRVMTAIRNGARPALRPRFELPLNARLRRLAVAAAMLILVAAGFAMGHWLAHRSSAAL